MHFASSLYGLQLLLLSPYIGKDVNDDCRYFSSRSDCFINQNIIDSTTCRADEYEPWTYRGRNGPDFWGERFPECNGREQSPVAISSYHSIPDYNLQKLALYNYNYPVTRATVDNNGHTIEVTPNDGIERSIDINGVAYDLEQLHFHWGDNCYRGSEHTINGNQFAMEMHLVHRNYHDQIAVVAVLFVEDHVENSELQNIIDLFPNVLFKNESTELYHKLNLNNLLPENPASFFRYRGSLTTPPCTEGVTWSVLTKALLVSKRQMDGFRSLFSAPALEASHNCKLINNFRPIQPLNHREIFISH